MMVGKSRKNRSVGPARGGYALLAFLTFGLLFCGAVPVRAATLKGGFTVTPAQLQFKLNTQSPEQTTELTILNNYDADLHLTAELNNIDEASVNLLPAGPLSDAALSAAISLSATDITVPASGTYKLQVQVRDNVGLHAGGHYASLVLTQQVPIGSAQVYRSALAVSLFVVKTDGIKTDLQLLGVGTKRWLFGLPTEVRLRFRNQGNVFVVPRTSASVYGKDASLLAQGIFNTDSRLLFPNQVATYVAPMTHFKQLWVPQKVHMVVAYRIQGNDVQLESRQTFWYIPPVYLAVPFLPFVMLAGLLAYKYRAAIVRKARQFAAWLCATTKQFIQQAVPVTKKTASIIRLALKRAWLGLRTFAAERRAAYFAWRLKHAEEQAAIQAAKDAVRAKPINLWADTDFADITASQDSPEPQASPEPEVVVKPSEPEKPTQPPVAVTPPEPPKSVAIPLEGPKPLAVELLSDRSKIWADTSDQASTGGKEVLAGEVPEAGRSEPQLAPQEITEQVPEPQEPPKPSKQESKPPELPKYKPVDYPGLRKLGLMPATAPKPEPAKQNVARGKGTSRVPQLVKSTRTTLPGSRKKKAPSAVNPSSRTGAKSFAKSTKKSAAKSAKSSSSRPKSSGSA